MTEAKAGSCAQIDAHIFKRAETGGEDNHPSALRDTVRHEKDPFINILHPGCLVCESNNSWGWGRRGWWWWWGGDKEEEEGLLAAASRVRVQKSRITNVLR